MIITNETEFNQVIERAIVGGKITIGKAEIIAGPVDSKTIQKTEKSLFESFKKEKEMFVENSNFTDVNGSHLFEVIETEKPTKAPKTEKKEVEPTTEEV